MEDQQERWLVKSDDGTTAGPFTVDDLALMVAQEKLRPKQLARRETGGKTCRVGDLVGEQELEEAMGKIAAARQAARSARGETLAEAGQGRVQCPECGKEFRAVAGVCKHCGAQYMHVEQYNLGTMCPFSVAKIGGGGGLAGFSAESYTWQHLPCIGAYCMMWDVASEQCKIAKAAQTLMSGSRSAEE